MAYEPRGDYGDRGGGGQDGAFMKVRGRSESILLSLYNRFHTSCILLLAKPACLVSAIRYCSA